MARLSREPQINADKRRLTHKPKDEKRDNHEEHEEHEEKKE
jgi:hypothetical protein